MGRINYPLHELYSRTEDERHLCKVALHVVRDFHIPERFATASALDQEWSVDEDKLLIHCELTHETDWLREYRTARRDNPKLFSKGALGSDVDLRERLEELRNREPGRYQLLLQDVEAHVSAEHGQTRRGREQQEFTRRIRRSVGAGQRNVCVHVETRAGGEGRVKGSRDALMAASPQLRQLLSTARPDADGMYYVTLSERDATFDAFPDTFGAFEPKTVEHFCDACSLRDLQRLHADAADTLRDERALSEQQWSVFAANLRKRRVEYKRQTAELQAEEMESLKKVCSQCEDMDIKLITAMHRSHLKMEVARLTRRYDERNAEINGFFEAEEQKLAALRVKHEGGTARLRQLEERLKALEDRLESAFPDDCVGGMLVLCEVLGADEVKQHLLRKVADNPDEYLCMPALGCPLVRSTTLQQLAATVPWPVLAAASPRVAFSAEIIAKERRLRRATAAVELRELGTEELCAMADGPCPFPDLVSAEVAARRQGGGSVDAVALQPANAASASVASIERGGLTCTVAKPRRYATLVATHARLSGTGWGKWYWELQVDEFDRSRGGGLSVGWEAVTSSVCTFDSGRAADAKAAAQSVGDTAAAAALKGVQGLPGLCPGPDGQFGIAWTSDGMLHHIGVSVDVGEVYGAGDVIGVGLDQDRATVSFWKNGVAVQLPKSSGDPQRTDRSTVLALPNPETYHLAPAVSLYSAHVKQPLRITADFAGPYARRLPRLHAPYAQTMKQVAS